mgnify:CR=1 FL=1
MNVMSEVERFLEECRKEEIREQVLDLYFEIRDFLSIHEKLDENYMIYTELTEDGGFMSGCSVSIRRSISANI